MFQLDRGRSVRVMTAPEKGLVVSWGAERGCVLLLAEEFMFRSGIPSLHGEGMRSYLSGPAARQAFQLVSYAVSQSKTGGS